MENEQVRLIVKIGVAVLLVIIGVALISKHPILVTIAAVGVATIFLIKKFVK